MSGKVFGKSFWKPFSLFRSQQRSRCFCTQETPVDYTPGTTEHENLKNACRELLANPTQIPICIGEEDHGSRDVRYQWVPHNKRCLIAQTSTGNEAILEHGKRVAVETHRDWHEVPMQERIEICLKCADILANEDRHSLNASIMLGQSKTIWQAEEDTCRVISDLRNYAELLSKLPTDCNWKPTNTEGFVMRPTGGFVAAMTPYNWVSHAINLVLCPALMGRCVLWVPSLLNVLSSYKLFLAFEKAGLPNGVISFVPMNQNYFVGKATHTRHLAGLNYAGRLSEFEVLAKEVSLHMDRPNSFSHPIGPTEGTNFHFVHQSADVAEVATATVRAAFDFNGQRGNSCENLYVSSSLWQELRCALMEELSKLQVGDPFDFDTTNTAVICAHAYERLLRLLQHAVVSEDCNILCGGNHNSTHGFFIEPTIIECKSPQERIMNKEIEGPILCIYVYTEDEADELLRSISASSYTLSGAVFAKDEAVASKISNLLAQGAANIYINKPCIGDSDVGTDELPDFNHEAIANRISLLQHW